VPAFAGGFAGCKGAAGKHLARPGRPVAGPVLYAALTGRAAGKEPADPATTEAATLPAHRPRRTHD